MLARTWSTAWRGIECGQFLRVRRQVRRHGGAGHGPNRGPARSCGSALIAVVERAVRRTRSRCLSGEEDWNVAQIEAFYDLDLVSRFRAAAASLTRSVAGGRAGVGPGG